MASEAQNSPFIKNLASSDKKVRDTALSSLRAYLSAQTTIPPLDLLKLWKGLFYCLWMQDKPAIQQRLSRDLASLVLDLQDGVALPFVEAFWVTMAREWSGIEALRMDKFLYLVRQYVNVSFRVVARGEWGDGEKVERCVGIFEETPLSAGDVKVPNGIRYHVLDVYVDELEKVAGDAWEKMPVEKMLEPLSKIAKESPTKSVRELAKESLQDERVRRWKGEEAKGEEAKGEEGEDGEEEEWGGFDD
ncbi:hypothetical protein BU24DRAFT_405624 [Aaosphaeria arxii CBS 175.79]|uniref:Nucleolar protein NOP52 variant n=1 Tax=Aaosphaeria arxii CBS 175.79 TaxID=1450172 RepID=A0A6A5Y110_9PLEO|nr:uncharacterized protein BU24DRAFT_405624 [Aaosphaeria arxii CBS 175.79]KAF2018883.1 hypothetical protein BU24DRAFT_405624 [Aaosphaeria arxii CBS 175.79]